MRNLFLYENYQHLRELQPPSFFLDIENFTAVYERTLSVASVSLSKDTKEKSNFSLALIVYQLQNVTRLKGPLFPDRNGQSISIEKKEFRERYIKQLQKMK